MTAARVLHVDTGRGWRGGQQQVLYLHRALVLRGVESHLACTRKGELHQRAEAEGLPVTGLPLRGEWDVLSALALARLARRRGACLLHLHSSHAQTVGLLAARASKLAKVVVTRRVDFVPGRHPVNRWKYGRGVSCFIAISQAIRDILVAFGVPRERVRLVHSGVDPVPVAPGAGAAVRQELGVGPGEPLIGNIAHLADHKGQRYLIDAVPIVLEERPDARFVIVGGGELEARLRAQSTALGVSDRITFTGFRRDIPAVLDALDMFVMSSHLEGLGTIVLDALAAGKPVVATRAGGIPEMIEDGRDGLLVPPRDAPALARAVLFLLDAPASAARLAASGRRRVREEFSTEAMATGNLAVYCELLGAGR